MLLDSVKQFLEKGDLTFGNFEVLLELEEHQSLVKIPNFVTYLECQKVTLQILKIVDLIY